MREVNETLERSDLENMFQNPRRRSDEWFAHNEMELLRRYKNSMNETQPGWRRNEERPSEESQENNNPREQNLQRDTKGKKEDKEN